MITRRTWLKGVTAGAGSVVFSPLIQSLAAQVNGTYTPPKRFVFVLTDNGFYEDSAQPVGVPLEGELRQLPLGPLTLSKDIDPFTPYKDRLLIVQGLRARHAERAPTPVRVRFADGGVRVLATGVPPGRPDRDHLRPAGE